jgi:hypothetical protein
MTTHLDELKELKKPKSKTKKSKPRKQESVILGSEALINGNYHK